MSVLKYDASSLGFMALFRNITGVDAKDCFLLVDGTVVFVTEKGTTGLAVGKEGKNLLRLKSSMKKEVKIIETADNPASLVTNCIWPQKPVAVTREENIISITFPRSMDRRVLLTNNKVKLNQLKFIVKRYFPEIEDILLPQ
ncbi:MAG: NusA-like transcription termination signal-binding factor [archaeon]